MGATVDKFIISIINHMFEDELPKNKRQKTRPHTVRYRVYKSLGFLQTYHILTRTLTVRVPTEQKKIKTKTFFTGYQRRGATLRWRQNCGASIVFFALKYFTKTKPRPLYIKYNFEL